MRMPMSIAQAQAELGELRWTQDQDARVTSCSASGLSDMNGPAELARTSCQLVQCCTSCAQDGTDKSHDPSSSHWELIES